VHWGSYDEPQAFFDPLDHDVLAGYERSSIFGMSAPELSVDLHHPVSPDDALIADKPLRADGSRIACGPHDARECEAQQDR
jgi:hypothetical protein